MQDYNRDEGFVEFLAEENILEGMVNVRILALQTKEEFAELQVENLFEIKPFDVVVNKKEKDKFGVSDAVIVNLASISASTVRGILHEKLRGTIAQNEIFPLIDVSNFQNRGTYPKEKTGMP